MRYCLYACFLIFFCSAIDLFAQDRPVVFPALSPSDHRDTYFGTEVHDPFRFLEESRSSISQNWLKEQEQYHYNYFREINNTAAIRKRIEIRSQFENTLERRMGNYFFSYRFVDRNLAPLLYYRKKGQKVARELLNPSRFDEGQKSVSSIVDYCLSPDERFLAICISRSGSEWKEIKVIDLQSKRMLADDLNWIKLSSIAWKNNGFFYSRFEKPPEGEEKTALNLNSKIMYHQLGSYQQDDYLIFEQKDLPYGIFNVERLESGKVIIYGAEEEQQQSFQKIFIQDDPDPRRGLTPILINPNVDAFHYRIIGEHAGKFLVMTNRYSQDPALYWLKEKGQEKEALFSNHDENILRDAYLINNRIVALYSLNMIQHLIVYDLEGKELDRLYFNDASSISKFSWSESDSTLFFYKNTYAEPPRQCIYRLNTLDFVESKGARLNYRRQELVTELRYYPSHDGVLIPMTLIHRGDIKYNASQPTILYGYGGFGVPIEPFYDPGFVFFVQNGGVIAIPGIRGGGENGEAWHQAGRMRNKSNSIEDFAFAAKFLIKNRFTNEEKLVARGSSNGALVIAAAIQKYPNLFRAAVLEMGLYDMLRYDLFTTGYASVSEYGSSKVKDEFEQLYKYSPLHNVKTQPQFPAMYIITGDNDDRVPSLHSYKFVATLQHAMKPERAILLHTLENAGHYGSQSFQDLMENEARIYSFMFKELGLKVKIE